MTTQELEVILQEKKNLVSELENLLFDASQLDLLQSELASTLNETVYVKRLSIDLDLPDGTPLVATLVLSNGEIKQVFSKSEGSGVMEAMITAGVAHSTNAVETRKTAILALLGNG